MKKPKASTRMTATIDTGTTTVTMFVVCVSSPSFLSNLLFGVVVVLGIVSASDVLAAPTVGGHVSGVCAAVVSGAQLLWHEGK